MQKKHAFLVGAIAAIISIALFTFFVSMPAAKKSVQVAQCNTLVECQNALKSEPDGYYGNSGMADLLLREGQYAEAAPHLEKVVAARPEDRAAKYQLSIVLRKSGNPTKADQLLSELAKGNDKIATNAQTYLAKQKQ